jgi:hypothetical protein
MLGWVASYRFASSQENHGPNRGGRHTPSAGLWNGSCMEAPTEAAPVSMQIPVPEKKRPAAEGAVAELAPIIERHPLREDLIS